MFNKEDLEQINRFTRDRLGVDTLERYTGSKAKDFQPYILLTNFKKYIHDFAELFSEPIHHGSVMQAVHSSEQRLSIINFNIGSPAAALVIDLLSFVPCKAVLMLGMCGGLRSEYKIGGFFNPVAAIRAEGTSDSYLPPQCPSLSSFVIQRFVCETLDRRDLGYETGVVHSTNRRFWEFDEGFKAMLQEEQVQAIDMECATLFTVGFVRRVPIGALMLISDLPLHKKTMKTKKLACEVMETYTEQHLDIGIDVLKNMQRHEEHGFEFGYQF